MEPYLVKIDKTDLDFAAAVDGRCEPSITGKDGLRAVEVTVAAYKSAKSQRMVRV